MKKLCRKCDVPKDLSQFYKRASSIDGFRDLCKPCELSENKMYRIKNKNRLNKKALKRYYKRKKYIIQYIKSKVRQANEYVIKYLLTHSCVDCPEQNVLVLDFDHIKGKKKASLGDLIAAGRSTEIIQQEIDKCVVRCRNCHQKKTAKERNYTRYVILKEMKYVV